MIVNQLAGIIGQKLDTRDAKRKQQIDNTPDWGHSYQTFETTGFGLMVPTQSFDFSCTFESEPFFTWGAHISIPKGTGDGSAGNTRFTSEAFLTTSSSSGPNSGYTLPMLTAAVFNYKQDDNGLYTGASCYFRVDIGSTDNPGPMASVKLNWTLYFMGPSFKDVPDAASSARTLSDTEAGLGISVNV